MANTFVDTDLVVKDASLYLSDQLLAANLMNRSIEGAYATKVGQTIKVKVPVTLGSAAHLSSTTSATDITETSSDVIIEKHFYKRVDVTSDQSTFSLSNFTEDITIPAVNSLIRSVEDYSIGKIVGGFSDNVAGTIGTEPSTLAHIAAAEKVIFDNRGDMNGLAAILDSTAYASFWQLDKFTSVDYGAERPQALREMGLGKLGGISYFRSPNAGTFSQGDIAGTVLCKGAVAVGDTTITADGFTAATGYVEEGTKFTVAGTADVYTVTKRTAIASHTAILPISPAATTIEDDDDALTFGTAQKECVIYNPKGVAGAIVPGAVLGANQAAASYNGIGLRVTNDVSTSTLAGSWVFDLYCGVRVVRPEYGVLLQG